jgi:hypothetical protein
VLSVVPLIGRQMTVLSVVPLTGRQMTVLSVVPLTGRQMTVLSVVPLIEWTDVDADPGRIGDPHIAHRACCSTASRLPTGAQPAQPHSPQPHSRTAHSPQPTAHSPQPTAHRTPLQVTKPPPATEAALDCLLGRHASLLAWGWRYRWRRRRARAGWRALDVL